MPAAPWLSLLNMNVGPAAEEGQHWPETEFQYGERGSCVKPLSLCGIAGVLRREGSGKDDGSTQRPSTGRKRKRRLKCPLLCWAPNTRMHWSRHTDKLAALGVVCGPSTLAPVGPDSSRFWIG